jgi:cytochrome c oxidase subunit 2
VDPPVQWIPYWLPGATDYAKRVDTLFAGLLASSILVTGLLLYLLLRFAIVYRAGSNADRDHRIRKSWHWEISWTVATLVFFLALFVWSGRLYLQAYEGPRDAMTVYVVAKQWMWKVQHAGGQREIDELHVPLGQSVRLLMTSQDVIHSFFIPAFRMKHDVLPGTYQRLWFKPQRAGVFSLLCAEYCGTDHSRMTGRIVVLEAPRFQEWLAQQGASDTLAADGERLFREHGCSGCHGAGGTVRAPPLEGLYGKPVPLQDGTMAVADDRYIRDSILRPRSQVAAGYAPVMPPFEGRLSEDELLRIVAYIKSLADKPSPPR